MTIRLEIIAGDSTEFAQKLLGVVGAISFTGQRTAAATQAAPAPADTPAPEEKPAVETAKPRARKAKEESAPAAEPEKAEEAAPVAEQVPPGEEKQPAAPSEEKAPSVMEAVSEEMKAECQAILRKVLTTKGNAVAAEILKKFGAKNISTIPAGKHAEFKAECEQVLGE